MINILKDLLWFVKSDVELKFETCLYDRVEKIDGFKFYSKTHSQSVTDTILQLI